MFCTQIYFINMIEYHHMDMDFFQFNKQQIYGSIDTKKIASNWIVLVEMFPIGG